MREFLISKDDIRKLHPILRGRFGNLLVKMIFRFVGIPKVNDYYDGSKHLTGEGFTTHSLDRKGIVRNVENYNVLDSFQDQAFITVSNHPYGHIDGIIAISVVAAKRKDFKMMVNWMLTRIDVMEENFIGVNPYAKGSKMANVKSSFGGVKQSLEHLKEGHPLGFFPAGGVSTSHLTYTKDREWQEPVLKLIRKAKLPVIPMYISGTNSWLYRFLGFIDWRLRMVRLFHEVANKNGKKIHIRFGEPILVEEQSQYEDIKAFGEFLKAKTYALQKERSPGVF
jgi:putative hemolysin